MEKSLDKKGRWRNRSVAFRMSPEESEELNTRVKLSGLTKQDYLIKRSLEKELVVVGNIRLYKALRDQMAEILEELKRIQSGESTDDELLDIIRLINTTMEGLNK